MELIILYRVDVNAMRIETKGFCFRDEDFYFAKKYEKTLYFYLDGETDSIYTIWKYQELH